VLEFMQQRLSLRHIPEGRGKPLHHQHLAGQGVFPGLQSQCRLLPLSRHDLPTWRWGRESEHLRNTVTSW
jgi:hypothetical protein